jgi:LCP family protein required for cell wall assembly
MISTNSVSTYTKPKRKTLKIVLISILAIILGAAIFFGATAYNAIKKITSFSKGGVLSILGSNQQLVGQSDGRTNILLLGYGGPGHDGPYLTDTMQVLSIDWKDKKVAMISVPRDLWVNIPNYGWSRINAAYSYGQSNPKITGGAGAESSSVVSNVLGIPIHYFVALDFDGFKEIIDKVGGVDIDVPNTFTDYQYPAGECITSGPGCGYITVHFDAGEQHMDGTRALEFARSRHGNNGEGTDFARSKRQQLVLEATKQKVLQVGVLANPVTLTDLINIVGNHLSTNLTPGEIKSAWSQTKDIDTSNMITKTLDTSSSSVLQSTTINGADVLIPKKGIGNYTDLQAIAQNIFGAANSATAESPADLKIEVLNGSGKGGVATTYANVLKGEGYNVTTISTATQVYTDSIVYNCSGASASKSASEIASDLKTTAEVQSSCGAIDIEVIIGQNYVL